MRLGQRLRVAAGTRWKANRIGSLDVACKVRSTNWSGSLAVIRMSGRGNCPGVPSREGDAKEREGMTAGTRFSSVGLSGHSGKRERDPGQGPGRRKGVASVHNLGLIPNQVYVCLMNRKQLLSKPNEMNSVSGLDRDKVSSCGGEWE